MWLVVAAGLIVFPIGLHLLIGERPIGDIGPRALLDTAFALALAAVVLLIAVGLGQRILRLNAAGWSLLDRTVWAAPIGLGFLAYGVLALGLIGWLQPGTLGLWLVIAGGWTRREWLSWLGEVRPALSRVPLAWCSSSRARRLFVLAAVLIFALALLQALTPPYDYDGLMYHLQGPRLFLQASRITVLPDNWQANGPATLDTLFILGLAFGSDTFAKLMHLTCGILLVLGVFGFGQRYIRPNGGWFAAAILLSIPIFSMWASWAYADMAWALFEFLGLYALIVWRDQRQRRWLFIGGAFLGLALGSKYLALGTTALLGLWVIWHSRRDGAKALLLNGARFGGTAVLVGSPWYLKNWLLAGNPLYPFIFGGVGWDRMRLDWLLAFLYSFGNGHMLADYVRLPWDLYMQRANFTGFMGGIEWPSLLFPFAALYVFMRHNIQLNTVSTVVVFQLILWAVGSHQTRFLLPVFPGLSLLAAAVLMRLLATRYVRRWAQVLMIGFGAAFVGSTLLIVLLFFLSSRPWLVISGAESRDAFLRRMSGSYATLQFIQHQLDPQVRVLLMWDGRGYYCDARCLPDTAQSQWTQLVEAVADPAELAALLRGRGITQLLYSPGDAQYIAQRDQTGRHQHAIDFFQQQFRPACTRVLYEDEFSKLYELTCR
jgi:hypothetical protein